MMTKLIKMMISGEKYVAIICVRNDTWNTILFSVYLRGSSMLMAYVGVSSVKEIRTITRKSNARFSLASF